MTAVSIIVPNYNHAPYLKQRLDSIFNQTFQDFEVIILDDCSTDNSRDVIENYHNRPQVSHIVYNETNSGSPFKQWAKGISLAKGKYIWIAESDDWTEPKFLEENVEKLNNDKTLSLVFCNSFNENGLKPVKTQNTFNRSLKISSHEMLSQYMGTGGTIYNASSVLFRSKYAKEISKDYQNFISSGDYFFWVCMLEKGDVFYNFNSLNHYRIHNLNTSQIQAHSGRRFCEDLKIFNYLKSKHYLSFYNKQVVKLANLEQIEAALKSSPNNPGLLQAKFQWKKEIFSILFSKLVVKIGLFVWKAQKK